VVYNMKPPTVLQETLLKQAITSGFLDNIATLAPSGTHLSKHGLPLRNAYQSLNTNISEPLFIDRNSTISTRDFRQLPRWICFESLIRKTSSAGESQTFMTNVTPIEPAWLATLAKNNSSLLKRGAILETPPPYYDARRDAVMCAVGATFGPHGWVIPPLRMELSEALRTLTAPGQRGAFQSVDETYRWFGRYLLEGKVIDGTQSLKDCLNDAPAIITRKKPLKKVALLMAELKRGGVDCRKSLRRYWAEKDDKFLVKCLKGWVRKEKEKEVKDMWKNAVKNSVELWKSGVC